MRSRPGAALALLLAAGCFRPEREEPGRAAAIWRDGVEEARRSSTPGGGADAGRPDGRPRSRPEPSPTSPAVVSLTADEAVAWALRASPDLAAIRAGTAVARGRAEAASQLPNPQLRVTDMLLDPAGQNPGGIDVDLRFPLLRPGTLDARTHAEAMSARALEAEVRDAERRLARDVRRLHLHAVATEADLALASEGAVALGRRRALLAERAQAGTATQVDLALASLEEADAAETREALRSELLRAEADLGRLAGVLPPARVRCVAAPGELDPRPLPVDEAALTARAVDGRPEVEAAAAALARAEAELFLARRQRLPWPVFVQGGVEIGRGATQDEWRVGVGIDVPLLSLNGGEIEEREAEMARARLAERAAILGVGREVAAAAARVRAAEERLAALDRVLGPALAASQAALAEARRSPGAIDPLRLVLLESERWKLRRRRVAAARALCEARIDLDAAVGAAPAPR